MTRDRKSFPFPTSPEGDDRTNRRLSDPTDGTSTSSLSSAAASRPSSDTIKVAVRIRPLVASEQESKESPSWTWSENSIYPAKKGPNGQFQHPTVADPTSNGYHFDYLFYPEHTNQVIFNTMIKNIVSSTMDGFHGSVFSYGQTNSGKTFTMNGGPAQPGVIPQAIYQCFEAVNGYPDREFLLRVSYLEIYNEQIKDLLNTEPANIRIQHDPKVGTVLSGVKEVVVLNPEQVISLIRAGEAHRHVGSTDMNTKSSRSHTLFKVIVESKERNGGHSSAARVSTLNMVDLAGSESAKMTNAKGERFIESRHINQSLLTLSLIIQKLSEDKHGGKKTRHLPYRNSKLTRLLETALDGNAHIGIICTISPIAKCVDESSNTLKFAQRAKMVKMNAAVNEVVDDKTLLRAYRVEIEQLRARLKEFEAHSNSKAATPQKPNGHISSDSSTTADKDIDGAAYGEDDEEEENQRHMLQMIAEMERLILKADASKGIKAKSASRSPTSSSRGENGTSSEQASSSRPSSLRLAVGDGNAAPNSTPSLSNQAADSGKEQDHIAAASHPSSSRAQIVSIKKPADSAVNKSKLRPPLRKSQLKAPTQFAHSSTSHDPSDGKVTVVKNSADGGMDKNVGSQVSISTSNSLAGSIDDQEEDQIDGVIGTHSNRYFVSTDEFDANFVDDNGYSLESPSQEERRNFSLLHSHSKHLVIEEDNVLTGVTKMLEQLKGYIAKPNRNQSSFHKKVLDGQISERVELVRQQLQAEQDTIPDTTAVATASVVQNSTEIEITKEMYDRLRLDLQLKAADNRFLQEELDNKDRMLAMLTDGLKEVEISQSQWLNTNQELAEELDQVAGEADGLNLEVQKLNQVIHLKDTQIASLESTVQQQQQHIEALQQQISVFKNSKATVAMSVTSADDPHIGILKSVASSRDYGEYNKIDGSSSSYSIKEENPMGANSASTPSNRDVAKSQTTSTIVRDIQTPATNKSLMKSSSFALDRHKHGLTHGFTRQLSKNISKDDMEIGTFNSMSDEDVVPEGEKIVEFHDFSIDTMMLAPADRGEGLSPVRTTSRSFDAYDSTSSKQTLSRKGSIRDLIAKYNSRPASSKMENKNLSFHSITGYPVLNRNASSKVGESSSTKVSTTDDPIITALMEAAAAGDPTNSESLVLEKDQRTQNAGKSPALSPKSGIPSRKKASDVAATPPAASPTKRPSALKSIIKSFSRSTSEKKGNENSKESQSSPPRGKSSSLAPSTKAKESPPRERTASGTPQNKNRLSARMLFNKSHSKSEDNTSQG